MAGGFDLSPGAPLIYTDRSRRHPQPWVNGQGTTEVIAATDDWRVSVADVPTSSAFSSIAGFDRLFVPLGEESIEFDSPTTGRVHRVQPLRPFAFPGEWAPVCRIGAPTRALNVMTRRDTSVAEIHVGAEPAPLDTAGTRIFVSVDSEKAIIAPPETPLSSTPENGGTIISILLSDAPPRRGASR